MYLFLFRYFIIASSLQSKDKSTRFCLQSSVALFHFHEEKMFCWLQKRCDTYAWRSSRLRAWSPFLKFLSRLNFTSGTVVKMLPKKPSRFDFRPTQFCILKFWTEMSDTVDPQPRRVTSSPAAAPRRPLSLCALGEPQKNLNGRRGYLLG
jgi:hypothetical protein